MINFSAIMFMDQMNIQINHVYKGNYYKGQNIIGVV